MTVHDITSFKIHQFKGVRATVEIHPNGPGLIVIGGANGSGKSSVVDGIMQLMSPSGIKGIPKPINEGKDSAYIEMTTSLAVVRRDYPKDGPGDLKATAIDGAKYGSGKDFMLKSTGGQVFDTAEFAGLDTKDQRAELLRRVDLPFDVDELDAKRKGYFDARTDKTREVKRLAAQLAGFAPADASIPLEEVSAAGILAELKVAQESNVIVDRLAASAEAAQSEREQAEKNLARLDDELDAARTFLLRAKEAEVDLLAEYKLRLPRIDTEGFGERLNSVEEANAAIRAQAARAALAAELADRTAEEADLTANLTAIDKAKVEALAAAVFPVKGLGIDATGITFDLIPFRQVNPAQQIIVAFDLFTVDKPDLRIIFIKNGDLLDNTSLAGIEKLAIERGYYVIVERDRDNSGALGWTMKDGALAVSA
jgi:thymidylate kinase